MALALLAVVVRSTDVLAGIDTSAAEWGNRHASPWTHDGLTLVTYLGRDGHRDRAGCDRRDRGLHADT